MKHRVQNLTGGRWETVDNLELVYDINGSSVFDMEDQPEDLEEGLARWFRGGYWYDDVTSPLHGHVSIHWIVSPFHETAPLCADSETFGANYDKHYSTATMDGMWYDVRKLPVRPWREWIEKATGWKPAPLTPFVHVNTLMRYEAVPGIADWHKTLPMARYRTQRGDS